MNVYFVPLENLAYILIDDITIPCESMGRRSSAKMIILWNISHKMKCASDLDEYRI